MSHGDIAVIVHIVFDQRTQLTCYGNTSQNVKLVTPNTYDINLCWVNSMMFVF